MHSWHDVKISRVTPQDFLAVIEISKGSKNKYELDKETGHLILDRVLFTSTHYPQNYGFIPRTFADDYDPFDVLVLCSEAIVPMSLVECFPIGVLIMTDGGLPDEKIIAVCKDDPFYKDFKDITDIPDHVMAEIKHFFTVYKSLEDKDTAVDEVYGRDEAIRVIKECLASYKRNIQPKVVAERKARGY